MKGSQKTDLDRLEPLRLRILMSTPAEDGRLREDDPVRRFQPGEGDEYLGCVGVAAGLLRRAERWKSQSSGLANMAVSCPLAQGISYGAQVVLWLEWLGGRLRLTEKALPVADSILAELVA